jgi:hypothetical protein
MKMLLTHQRSVPPAVIEGEEKLTEEKSTHPAATWP